MLRSLVAVKVFRLQHAAAMVAKAVSLRSQCGSGGWWLVGARVEVELVVVVLVMMVPVRHIEGPASSFEQACTSSDFEKGMQRDLI